MNPLIFVERDWVAKRSAAMEINAQCTLWQVYLWGKPSFVRISIDVNTGQSIDGGLPNDPKPN